MSPEGPLAPISRAVSLGDGALEVTLSPCWLTVRFEARHAVLSSALVGGGRRRTRIVAWHEVRNAELGPNVDPERLFKSRLTERRLSGAVGLLTSRSLDRFVTSERTSGTTSAQVVATVGLGNALRAGDPPGLDDPVGTINILCRVSVPLTEEAAIETLSIVAEARTLAVLEGSLGSCRTGLPSTGTGTDCIAVASPIGRGGIRYAGKHTDAGHVVGAAVTDAIRRGVKAWLDEQRSPTPAARPLPAGR